MKESLSLSLDEASGAVHARFDPASGMPPPDHTMLTEALAGKGWGNFHIDDKVVASFLTDCRKVEQPLEMIIGARRDGHFDLELDGDLMTAWLTLIPPQGGKAVTLEMIAEEIVAKGIVHGVLRSEVEAALAAGQCERLVIARGVPAQEGTPTRFETLYDREEESEASGEEEEDLERVKYTDLCHILLVEPGDKLMRRTPPVPGKSGMNILGHAVLPKPVPDIGFQTLLTGAEPDKKDPNLLIANLGGQPTRTNNGVTVNPVLEVLNVDLGTGSIKFQGTLRVGGDIKAGLRVEVTGDVVVNGTVESAEIVAGGNVAVRGGIVGHLDGRPGSHSLPETTARIFCKGTVQALFMESVHVEAGKSIMVTRSARQCELIASEEIVVGKPGSKGGHITGGKAQATHRIATGVLGSNTGMKTHIQVGVDPYLEQQIADKEKEMQRAMDELDRVIKLLAYFKQNPKKGEGGVAEKVEATRKHLIAAIDTLTNELKIMRDKLQLTEQARVEVADEIFYGVEVHIAQQVWQVPDDMGGAVIQMQGSRIAVNR